MIVGFVFEASAIRPEVGELHDVVKPKVGLQGGSEWNGVLAL